LYALVVVFAFITVSPVSGAMPETGIRLFLDPMRIPAAYRNVLFHLALGQLESNSSAVPFKVGKVTFKELLVEQGLNFDDANVTLFLNSSGFTMITPALNGQVSWIVDVEEEVVIGNSRFQNTTTYQGTANINAGEMRMTINLGNKDGVPELLLPVFDLQTWPEYIDLGNPNVTAVENIMKTVIANYVTINTTVDGRVKIPETVDALISGIFATGTKNITIFGVDLVVDYHLSEKPVFTNDYFTLSFKGDLITDGKGCDISRGNIPNSIKLPTLLGIGIDAAVIECIVMELGRPEVLEKVLNNLPIKLDNRIKIMPGVNAFTWDFDDPKSLKNEIYVALSMPVARGDWPGVPVFANLHANFSATMNPVLNKKPAPANSTIDITLTQAEVSYLLANDVDPKLVPARYVEQIANEKWKDVETKINDYLKEHVLPKKLSFDLPADLQSYLGFLTELEYQTGDKYAIILADLSVGNIAKYLSATLVDEHTPDPQLKYYSNH